LIVEDELQGEKRAAYGKAVLKNLSDALTLEFGPGFNERNLNNMRAFYRGFPIWNAVRTESDSSPCMKQSNRLLDNIVLWSNVPVNGRFTFGFLHEVSSFWEINLGER
jgi:hypothetical protein